MDSRSTRLLSACALVLVTGCGLIKINGKTLGGRPGGDGAAEASDEPGTAGESAPPRKARASSPEDEATRLAEAERERIQGLPTRDFFDLVKGHLFGEINVVKELKDQPHTANVKWATGEFMPASSSGSGALKSRLGVELARIAGARDAGELWERTLAIRLCEEKRRFAGQEAQASGCAKEKYLRPAGYGFQDPLNIGLLLDVLLTSYPEADARKIREQFVASFGYGRQLYEYTAIEPRSGTIYGVKLEAKPLSEWTYRTLRYAHAYSERHGLDAGVRGEIASAMKTARRYRCVKMTDVYFIQEHEGGGRYGAMSAGSWQLGGDEIECDAVKVKSPGWAMKALRASSYEVDKWLGAETIGAWEVERDDDNDPVKKMIEAVVYYREEI